MIAEDRAGKKGAKKRAERREMSAALPLTLPLLCYNNNNVWSVSLSFLSSSAFGVLYGFGFSCHCQKVLWLRFMPFVAPLPFIPSSLFPKSHVDCFDGH